MQIEVTVIHTGESKVATLVFLVVSLAFNNSAISPALKLPFVN